MTTPLAGLLTCLAGLLTVAMGVSSFVLASLVFPVELFLVAGGIMLWPTLLLGGPVGTLIVVGILAMFIPMIFLYYPLISLLVLFVPLLTIPVVPIFGMIIMFVPMLLLLVLASPLMLPVTCILAILTAVLGGGGGGGGGTIYGSTTYA